MSCAYVSKSHLYNGKCLRESHSWPDAVGTDETFVDFIFKSDASNI